MYHDPRHYNQGSSGLTSTIDALSFVLAFVSTFFATPPAYGFTAPKVQAYVQMHVGYGLEGFTAIVWGATLIAMLFLVSRLTLSAAFTALASRFFSRFL